LSLARHDCGNFALLEGTEKQPAYSDCRTGLPYRLILKKGEKENGNEKKN
jgi:hypothetical protein